MLSIFPVLLKLLFRIFRPRVRTSATICKSKKAIKRIIQVTLCADCTMIVKLCQTIGIREENA